MIETIMILSFWAIMIISSTIAITLLLFQLEKEINSYKEEIRSKQEKIIINRPTYIERYNQLKKKVSNELITSMIDIIIHKPDAITISGRRLHSIINT